MKYKAFWLTPDGNLEVLDQRYLPHKKETLILKSAGDVTEAIKNMTVRGAGTIGSTGAFGIYLSSKINGGISEKVAADADEIRKSRPTAVNLEWAVLRMMKALNGLSGEELTAKALQEAIAISDEDIKRTEAIGKFGCDLLEKIKKEKNLKTINILTHCNAGWLGIVDSGTALAPMYEAKKRGLDIHVWVDETRPRNQGALTAWELAQENIPHTYITDNAGGLLMQQGKVDIVFTGADRVTRNGDAANKIGTYLKALAAKDNGVPFYVNLPISTIDFEMKSGDKIPIENRPEDEVSTVSGMDPSGKYSSVRVVSEKTQTLNPAFDVTPARLITGLITEKGVITPDESSVIKLKN